MDVIELPIDEIIPYARNPRRNEDAVATVAASLAEFGWRQPIVVDEQHVVLAGHTRLEAAKRLGLKTAPVHVARGLSAAQVQIPTAPATHSDLKPATCSDLMPAAVPISSRPAFRCDVGHGGRSRPGR